MSRGRPRKGNKWYVDSEGVVHVILNNTSEELLCDLEDWEYLKSYTWFQTHQGYVRSDSGPGYRLFHLSVVDKPEGMDVDHINGNPLDNRKVNLRVCTHQENCMNQQRCIKNTSGISGVTWYAAKEKWRAQIVVEGLHIHLGYFDNLDDAAKCRRSAEVRYFGSFAKQEV